MKLLVTGTRHATIADHGLIVRDAIFATLGYGTGPHEVYVGDAGGVDLIARQLARQYGFGLREFTARWEECAADCPEGTPSHPHRRQRRGSRDTYCPAAGMRRNRTMVAAYVAAGGKRVLAFPAANVRSSGTTGCIREAKRTGLDVADPIPLTVEVCRD